ncbi:Lsr2 family protein [Streptosporangium sp. NPDC050855]|uniref:Lsr2 family protein n=1 Tax=Streptosporangium sp. NPDC050855 TaxID=3366194 RepID=UPI0037B7F82A
MAKRIQEILIDDIDGGEADETILFGLDGGGYEIDLSGSHAKQLREALAPFVESARRVREPVAVRRRRGSSTPSIDREKGRIIRAWAKDKGIEVSERGRIAASVVEQYEAAH